MVKLERWYADPIIAAALAEPDTDYLGECQARTERLMARLRRDGGEQYANTCPECDNGVVTIFHSHLRDWETGEYLDISEVPCGACEDGLLLTPVELVDFDPVAMDAYLAGADRDVDVDTEGAA